MSVAARAKVAGTGAYLPGEPITNKELAGLFGRDVERLSEMLGAETRHLALDLRTGRLRDGESNARMAYEASVRALENAGLAASDVDLIILSTSTPDYPFPATALFLQELLGVPECQVMEFRAGCGGMAQAFVVGEQFILSGRAKAALLVGSELISPFHRLLSTGDASEKGDLVAKAMFGDGAGAAVLVPTDGHDGAILGCMFRSIGTGQAPGMILKTGGALAPSGLDGPESGPAFAHDFRAILQRGPELMERAAEWVWRSGIVADHEIAYYVPPQANGHLITSMSATKDLQGAKVFLNFDKVGNTASASIYIALDTMNRDKHLEAGDIVVLLPSEATKWTYGAVILRW
jgi:3-oxoacyl-[acyl-carrier-protein] synthase III